MRQAVRAETQSLAGMRVLIRQCVVAGMPAEKVDDAADALMISCAEKFRAGVPTDKIVDALFALPHFIEDKILAGVPTDKMQPVPPGHYLVDVVRDEFERLTLSPEEYAKWKAADTRCSWCGRYVIKSNRHGDGVCNRKKRQRKSGQH